MKKTVLQILTGITAAVLTYIVTIFVLDPLSKWPRPLPWLLALAVFFLVVTGLFSLSSETIKAIIKAIKLFIARSRQRMLSAYTREPEIFSKLFSFEDEGVRVVYTCRSRIDKAPCPMYENPGDAHLLHVINQHVPVDEFLTQHLIVQWYKPLIHRQEHEALTGCFTCTYPLDIASNELDKGKLLNRADLPDYIFGNLIVVGENSCANLMLDRLYPLLNFYPSFSVVEEGYRKTTRRRIHIDLIFANRNGNAISQDEKLMLHTSFDKNNSNAVAMLCYAPNPFNVQKRVLILYGAHRIGQYLLEEWLHRRELNDVLQKLIKIQNLSSPDFGQIVLHSPFIEKNHPEDYEYKRIAITKNVARKQIPFFPFNIPERKLTREGFRIDAGADKTAAMVDISLIIDLPAHDPQITSAIDNVFMNEMPFLHGHYWESKAKDTSLHVTLYEFATHPSHETLLAGIDHFETLRQELAQNLVDIEPPCLSLTGCEVLPSAIILYADLPTSFLDVILQKCHPALPEIAYFNRRRMPFPMHCTVLRFNKSFNKQEQEKLVNFGNQNRKRVFGELQVHTLSLLLARKQPYQEVERRFNLKLQMRNVV